MLLYVLTARPKEALSYTKSVCYMLRGRKD